MSYGLDLDEAAAVLHSLADAFLSAPGLGNKLGQLSNSLKLNFEARYKALIERIPAVVFVAPLAAGLGSAYVSPQIESILGFTQEEWLGDPLRWYQQVHPDDKHRWSVEAASLFSTGEPLCSNFRVLSRDGRVIWFQCDARMVLAADGSPSFIHGVGFDVSELKETEISLKKAQQELEFRVAERTRELAETNAQLKGEIEQHKRLERELIAAKETAEQAARVKMEFLANMSHEIRTPMNGVLGFTNLVLETQLSAEQREYLSTAYHSAESLLGIINQVLDFSKLESGNARLHPIDFHLRESLQLLIRELTTLAAQKNLELSCHIAPDVPDNLKGDLGRLRQVLTNLIGNAIKFTHAGCVKVTVASSEASLKFSVIDTGIGIPESKFKLIFEPFMQVDGSVTREYGGTGLGLAVSKNLVELMGGTLEVTSSPGEGSAFTFTARFDESDAAAPGKQAARKRGSQKPAVASPRTLRILIAEDNPVNQKVVLRLIEKAGHTVTLAQNGREAVEAYRKSVFDLVLMDVQMPVMDGLSATETIRALERDSGIARVPIIALTAHAMEEERTRCLKAGMDIHVTKPFQSAALLSLLDELAMAHDLDPRTRLPVDS